MRNENGMAPDWRVVTRRFPVTSVLIGTFVLIHLLVEITGGASSVANLIRWGAMSQPRIAAGEYWRFITPIFLHGGTLHLAINAFALYQLGPLCELLFGPKRYFAIFLLTGAGGSALSMLMSGDVIAVGASGALFGFAGLLLVTAWLRKEVLNEGFRRSLIHGMLPLVVFNLFLGFSVDGVDNYGHIGGLIAGALIGLVAHPGAREALWHQVVLLVSLAVVGWAGVNQYQVGRTIQPEIVATDVQYFLAFHRSLGKVLERFGDLRLGVPESREMVNDIVSDLHTLREEARPHFQLAALADDREELMDILLEMTNEVRALQTSPMSDRAQQTAVVNIMALIERFKAWSGRIEAWANHHGYYLRRGNTSQSQ
jgi:membrane associated rhomboid family serine protease